MVVLPSALQMGWNESPAFFCATTKTVRDVSQMWIDQGTELPAHAMESLVVEPTLPPRRQSSTNGASHQWSVVYVDDHIMAAPRVQRRPGKKSRNGATIYPPVEKAPAPQVIHPYSGELRK
jgi:hypothetical protein